MPSFRSNLRQFITRVTEGMSYLVPDCILRLCPKWVAVQLLPRHAQQRYILRLVKQERYDDAVAWLMMQFRKKRFRERLATWLRTGRWAQRATGPPLFIVGPVRTGKSTIATHLAKRLDLMRIELDRWSKFINVIPAGAARNAFKKLLFEAILDESGPGIVVEGITLMSVDRHDTDPSQTRLLSLEPACSLARKYHGMLTVVGAADSSPAEKRAAIVAHRERHGCWTLRADPWKLDRYCLQIVTISQQLKEQAAVEGLTYYEIRVDRFTDDIEAAVSGIITRMSPQTDFVEPDSWQRAA